MQFSKTCKTLQAQSSCKRPNVRVHSGRFNDSDLLIGGPGRSGNDRTGRIILPGQQKSGGQQKLFIPDDGRTQTGAGPGMVDLVGGAPAPTYNKYRPPAKFMEDILKEEEVDLSTDEMINRLQSRSGHWHELAKFLTPLNKAGYDDGTIDAVTGLTPKEQSIWLISSTLYDSLKEIGVKQDVLNYFNSEGDQLLYPFRFLEKDRRAAAAMYVVKNQLNAEECEVLARAMKEWERRPFERAGFADTPADCLAFKYLRDAGEVKTLKEIQDYVNKGLALACSEGATARLMEVLDDATGEKEKGTGPAASTAVLMSLRLNFDEMGFRPIPVLGEYSEVTAEQITNAPKATTRGPFGAFIFPEDSSAVSWVALPQWKAVAMAPNPAGLTVSDCTTIPAVLNNINYKNKDELKKVSGPGLLVVDMWKGGEVLPGKFYISQTGRMVDGTGLTEDTVVAEVLFLCRPPIRENTLESTGTDLLTI